MRPSNKWTEVIDGKRYNCATATLIAGDDWWDGRNYERHGTNTFLFRTPKGAYFTCFLTQWQGERDRLNPVSQGDAIALYQDELTEHYENFEDAFPGVVVEDA